MDSGVRPSIIRYILICLRPLYALIATTFTIHGNKCSAVNDTILSIVGQLLSNFNWTSHTYLEARGIWRYILRYYCIISPSKSYHTDAENILSFVDCYRATNSVLLCIVTFCWCVPAISRILRLRSINNQIKAKFSGAVVCGLSEHYRENTNKSPCVHTFTSVMVGNWYMHLSRVIWCSFVL